MKRVWVVDKCVLAAVSGHMDSLEQSRDKHDFSCRHQTIVLSDLRIGSICSARPRVRVSSQYIYICSWFWVPLSYSREN